MSPDKSLQQHNRRNMKVTQLCPACTSLARHRLSKFSVIIPRTPSQICTGVQHASLHDAPN
jgi:hypothetical protein